MGLQNDIIFGRARGWSSYERDSIEDFPPTCPHCHKEFKSWPLAKRHVKFCRAGKNPRQLQSNYNGEKNKMSIRDEMNKRGGENARLLHGSDLPAKQTSVTIVVKELRAAPDNFNSIAIIDFSKPVFECEAWAVNKTNLKALLEKFGLDEDNELEELDAKIRGKKITLAATMVNNPQTKKMTRSLFVA